MILFEVITSLLSIEIHDNALLISDAPKSEILMGLVKVVSSSERHLKLLSL